MEQPYWVFLLAITVTFFTVFIQILSRKTLFERVLYNKAVWREKAIFVLAFGGFSIMGTLLGVQLPSGAIINVRDLGPLVAGLVGGPLVGLSAGLVGGIHRLFLGGLTGVPCALATILIGLIAGLVKKRNSGLLISIWWAILFSVAMELFHIALVLLISRPFSEALAVSRIVILPMVLANSVGIAIAFWLMPQKILVAQRRLRKTVRDNHGQ